jgi:hypothetical protein
MNDLPTVLTTPKSNSHAQKFVCHNGPRELELALCLGREAYLPFDRVPLTSGRLLPAFLRECPVASGFLT